MPRVPTTGHLPFPLDHVKIEQQIFFNNESYPQDRKKVDKKVKIRQPYLWDFNISHITYHISMHPILHIADCELQNVHTQLSLIPYPFDNLFERCFFTVQQDTDTIYSRS